MIKKERLIQVTACLVMCVMMPASVTCNAASIPCEITKDSLVAGTMSEKLVEKSNELWKNIQEERKAEETRKAEEVRKAEEAKKAEEERWQQEIEIQTACEAQNMTAVSSDAQELLASIIFCEAGNQPYEGQVAVGAVVLNRVASDLYPNSVEEVIYQSGQFGPAVTGWLDQVRCSAGYTPETLQAAADALNGVDPVEGCLYFDQGGYGMQIGAHYFH